MSNYPINPAFVSIPNIRITRNIVRLRLISFTIGLTRLFYKWGDKVEVRHHKIETSDGYLLKLLEVAPTAAEPLKSTLAPALMYYHGGGFFLTYGAVHLNMIKSYALKANCSVFLVDYRLSTKFAFPTPFDDCYESLEWVNDHAAALRIDKNRIAVGGDSAGGCLAAAVAQKALDKANAAQSDIMLVGQLLIYPVTDCETKTKSAREFNDTPVWTTEANKIMWALYLKNSLDAVAGESSTKSIPPYASPIHREGFADLPPAYIEAVEFDPLRDEANDYAQALLDAGVAVQVEQISGGVHGYDMVKSEVGGKYKTQRVKALSRFFKKQP